MLSDKSDLDDLVKSTTLSFPQPLSFFEVWGMLEYSAGQVKGRVEIEMTQHYSRDYMFEKEQKEKKQYCESRPIHGEFMLSDIGTIPFSLPVEGEGSRTHWTSIAFRPLVYVRTADIPPYLMKGIETVIGHCRKYLEKPAEKCMRV